MTKTILTTVLALSIRTIAADPAPAKPIPASTAPLADSSPSKSAFSTVYEDITYSFDTEEAKNAFVQKVTASIYHQIGGKASMEAAIEIFYKKVLADDRINHFFKDTNMAKQKQKQKAFLSAAFGSPVKWTGLDMRTAHADLPGLNDIHFNAVAGHLQATLEELKVKKELIDQIMTAAGSLRDDVLNRKPAAK